MPLVTSAVQVAVAGVVPGTASLLAQGQCCSAPKLGLCRRWARAHQGGLLPNSRWLQLGCDTGCGPHCWSPLLGIVGMSWVHPGASSPRPLVQRRTRAARCSLLQWACHILM